MRSAMAALAVPASLPVMAMGHCPEAGFQQASKLLPWCETEARAHFTGMELKPSSGRHDISRADNTLHVEGKPRTCGKGVSVACRAPKSARGVMS